MKNTSSDRFLSRPSKKIAGRVQREHHAGGEADARREQPRAREREQHARRRSDQRLDDPDEQQAAAGDRVDDAEQIRIERRLVEDFVSRASRRRRSAAPTRRSRANRPSAPQKNGAARICQTCTQTHGERERRRSRERPPEVAFFGNGVMLAQHVSGSNRGARRARRETDCSAISACSAVAFCSGSVTVRVSAAALTFYQGHRADRLAALRAVPSSRPDWTFQPDDLRRRAESRRADRGGHRPADHAALET